MEFKGTRGKLHVESYKEDLYVNIVTENGSSVAGISTTDDQFEEATYYGKLFSKAPEMLELLKESLDTFTCNDSSDRDLKSRIEQLIHSATTI